MEYLVDGRVLVTVFARAFSVCLRLAAASCPGVAAAGGVRAPARRRVRLLTIPQVRRCNAIGCGQWIGAEELECDSERHS